MLMVLGCNVLDWVTSAVMIGYRLYSPPPPFRIPILGGRSIHLANLMGLNASPPKCVEIPDVRSCCRTFGGALSVPP